MHMRIRIQDKQKVSSKKIYTTKIKFIFMFPQKHDYQWVWLIAAKETLKIFSDMADHKSLAEMVTR